MDGWREQGGFGRKGLRNKEEKEGGKDGKIKGRKTWSVITGVTTIFNQITT